MPIQSPNLDDRSWQDLMDAAMARIRTTAPDWTDLTAGDPGVVLLDAFAFLTEALIYRLNQVPDKLYIEFLRLMGVRLGPPGAATTTLVFRRTGDVTGSIDIPAGTRVTLAAPTGTGEAPIFATAQDVTLATGRDEVRVRALHAEFVDAEPAALALGPLGSRITLRRPPVVAPTGEPGDLIVAVEALPGELREGDLARRHDGRDYRVWREVDAFVDLGSDREVYSADRLEGSITFSPWARWTDPETGVLSERPHELGGTPVTGRDIRIWYRRGGGSDGNVAPGALTSLVDGLSGVEVTNPEAATGGRAGETLENALIRGPQEFHARRRAVTARDFELVAAQATGDIARARAFTKADLWRYARPGSVELSLVPALLDPARAASVTIDQLREVQTDRALNRVLEVIDERRPLGTSCEAHWAGYKSVRVRARISVQREEDQFEVRRRVDERIRSTVNPLSVGAEPGWQFGESLYASSVYKIILSEPGVQHVTGVTLVVDDSPATDVEALAADPIQPRTWYAGSGERIYRSMNNGDGWEVMSLTPGETVARLCPHPMRAGLLAATTELPELHSRVWLSRDSGTTWEMIKRADWLVADVTWIDLGDDEPATEATLLLATTEGLFRLSTRPGSNLQEVPVDPSKPGRGLAAVTSVVKTNGEVSVAVALRESGGIWLWVGSGKIGAFRPIGLDGQDVRVLAVQAIGSNYFLWAGTQTAEGDGGCHRWHLIGNEDPPGGWQARVKNWSGGSCHAIAFLGDTVLAGTHDQGVLWLDSREDDPAWSAPGLQEEKRTLPLRGDGKRLFHQISSLAADPDGSVVMAGGPVGIWRSSEGEAAYRAGDPRYENASRQEFTRNVTIPPTWLFVNGENELEMASDDASPGPAGSRNA